MYVDGQLVVDDAVDPLAKSWLDSKPFLVVGTNCYAEDYLDAAAYTSCNFEHQFNGAMDDVAIFAGALSPEEVRGRWNSSLSDRLAAGSEPNLVMFWDFDQLPSVDSGCEVVPNLGSAGSDYDMVLGRLPKPEGSRSFGRYYSFANTNYEFISPQLVPGGIGDGRPISASAPLVLSAPANASVQGIYFGGLIELNTSDVAEAQIFNATDGDGTLMRVHVRREMAPLPPGGSSINLAGSIQVSSMEDTSYVQQLWGFRVTDTTPTVRITRLPARGRLFDIPHRASIEDESHPILVLDHLVSGSRYVMCVSEDRTGDLPSCPICRVSLPLLPKSQ